MMPFIFSFSSSEQILPILFDVPLILSLSLFLSLSLSLSASLLLPLLLWEVGTLGSRGQWILKIQRFLGTTGREASAAGRCELLFKTSTSCPAQAPKKCSNVGNRNDLVIMSGHLNLAIGRQKSLKISWVIQNFK